MSAQQQDQIGSPVGTTGLVLFGIGASVAIVGGAYLISKSIKEGMGYYAAFPPYASTMAELATDRLRDYADQIDRAGSRGSALLAQEKSDTAGALGRLASALDDANIKLATRARSESNAVRFSSVSSGELRLWANFWEGHLQ